MRFLLATMTVMVVGVACSGCGVSDGADDSSIIVETGISDVAENNDEICKACGVDTSDEDRVFEDYQLFIIRRWRCSRSMLWKEMMKAEERHDRRAMLFKFLSFCIWTFALGNKVDDIKLWFYNGDMEKEENCR